MSHEYVIMARGKKKIYIEKIPLLYLSYLPFIISTVFVLVRHVHDVRDRVLGNQSRFVADGTFHMGFIIIVNVIYVAK